MDKTRYECSWCREIVGVSGGGLPPEAACSGQPAHSTHDWSKKTIVLRSRIPFEVERRHRPSAHMAETLLVRTA